MKTDCIYLKELINHSSCAILTTCQCKYGDPCSFYASRELYGLEIGTDIPYKLSELEIRQMKGGVSYGRRNSPH